MKIIVLGAGVVGVTTAWYLADAGHEVTVIERRDHPGMETSLANGGQISAGHAEPWAKPAVLGKLFSWLGREEAPLLFRPRAELAQWEWGVRFLLECFPGRFERNARMLAGLASHSLECLRTLRQRTGLRYDHLSRGILHLCTDRRDFEVLARHAEAMRKIGVAREVKTRQECIAIEPALADCAAPLAGGIYAPRDESGDAYKFTQGLATLCEERGVRFRTGVNVEALEAAGDIVTAARVRGTQPERIVGDAYVVSLGSYSPLLLAPLGVRIPVYPLKGYSITLPLEEREALVAPRVSITDEAHKIVISRLGDRLRAAGTAELAGYDTSVSSRRCEAIARRVRQLFPRLSHVAPGEFWAGLRPATPSNVPLVGRTRHRNLFLNTGHGTLGWTLACGSGRSLAELVCGRRPEVSFRFLNA
jgi:D-amino-acid dehydrogenase